MKLIKWLSAALIACTAAASLTAHASSGPEPEIIDEMWGNPILAHGSALTADQLQQTKNIFGLFADQPLDLVSVNGADMVRFLGSGNPNVNMFSSALITRGEPGTGVVVSILTPDNITRVTATQYANAMITAGIADAVVQVASPVRVTGESALTGIYKAYEDRGTELDPERMAVAQEELQTTSSIANYHEGNDDFDSENLDQALIEIKATLADFKYDEGELASDEQVQAVVQAALEQNDLAEILNGEQVQRLIGLAKRYQNTDAIFSQQVRDQLDSLANNLGNTLQNLRDAAEGSGVADAARGFIGQLFEFFRNLFSRES